MAKYAHIRAIQNLFLLETMDYYYFHKETKGGALDEARS